MPNSSPSSNLNPLMCLNSPRSGNMISYTSFTADQAISWMNFCKCLSNLSRILNNSNFERCHFAGSNCILEKMSFILLKNAAMKLYGFSELLTSQQADWIAKGNSGRFAEIQTALFLLNNEVNTAFETEWNRANSSSELIQQLSTDTSFKSVFNKDITAANDDENAEFYKISKKLVTNLICLLLQRQKPLLLLTAS